MPKQEKQGGTRRERITFQTTPSQREAIKSVGHATDRPKEADVVRDAIDYYLLIIERVQAGEKLFIGTDRDKAVEVLAPQFARARANGLMGK